MRAALHINQAVVAGLKLDKLRIPRHGLSRKVGDAIMFEYAVVGLLCGIAYLLWMILRRLSTIEGYMGSVLGWLKLLFERN